MRDAAVVGGGPAGAVTAMLLARAGFDVELFERAEFPRAKACGDCLSPGANVVLSRLGLLDRVLGIAPALLRGWEIHVRFLANSANINCNFANCTSDSRMQFGLAVERSKLDSVFLSAAIESGVTVTRATVDTLPVARLVVGADGLRSRVARRLDAYARKPILKKHSYTWHVPVDGVTDYGEMHVVDGACLGIAPVGDGTCNVTVVVTHGTLDEARKNFEYRIPKFSNSQIPKFQSSGPFDWPTKRIAFDNALLVGDAAGYYDPFTGQGIYQALTGAELAAEHGVEFLRNGKPLYAYEKRLRAKLNRPRRLQRGIEALWAYPSAYIPTFKFLQRAPTLTRMILARTSDMR